MLTPVEYKAKKVSEGYTEKLATILSNAYADCYNQIDDRYTVGYHDGRTDTKQHFIEIIQKFEL